MISLTTQISRLEWAGVLAVGLIVGLLASWPWLISSRQAPAGSTYLGTNIPDVLDSQVYYAFIQANADGQTAYHNLFTSEAHLAVLWNPLWWFLGLIVRWTGLATITVWWVAKAVLGVGLIAMIYRLTAVFFISPRWRFAGLALAVLGSGFGGLALVVLHQQPGLIWMYQRTDLAAVLPTDLTYSAGQVWMSILHSPLFVMSQMLVLWIWWTVIQPGRKNWVLPAGGLATVLLGLIHPYDVVLVFGVIFGGLVTGIMTNQLDQNDAKIILRRAGFLLAWATPAIMYYGLLLWSVPVIREWNANNVLLTTNPRTVVAGYGLILFFAVVGVRQRWPKQPHLSWLLVAWAGSSLAMMYVPFIQFQAKMIAGLSIPLGILAAIGAQSLWRRGIMSRPAIRTAASIFVMGATVVTPIMFIVRTVESQSAEALHHYVSADTVAAMEWLKTHTPQTSIVLGDIWTGNLVPNFAGRATYLGHLHQTIDYHRKLDLVRLWFFASAQAPTEKLDFLRTNSITHIWWGPVERRLGTFNPAAVPGLEVAYQNATVMIYVRAE